MREAATGGVVALDVVDEETLAAAGALVWSSARRMFALGSQGLEYALVAAWRAAGLAPRGASGAAAAGRGAGGGRLRLLLARR